MATLKEAEQAREETAEHLRRLGAHAISVEEETPGPLEAPNDETMGAGEVGAAGGLPRPGRPRTFVVVAWFADQPPADLPQTLEIRTGTRTKVVPLRSRRAERFRAE